MQVNVRLFGSLRELVPREKRGSTTIDLAPNASVQDVLDALGINHYVLVSVNDTAIDDHQITLQSGDSVLIFEAAAGG